MPKAYVAIMPDYLPAHRELVYASGAAELASALATLHPRTRRAGGVLGIATLIAIFPANVHMAQHPERYRKIPLWALYARLPAPGAVHLLDVARHPGRTTRRAGRRRSPARSEQ